VGTCLLQFLQLYELPAHVKLQIQFLQLYELPVHVKLQIQFLQLYSDLIRNSQTRKSQFFMPFTGSLPQLGGI